MSTKIIACAGSGKTTYLINMIKNLKLNMDEFIVFTFSRCSCNDFTSRLLEEGMINKRNVRTLHSFAYQIINNDIISLKTIIVKASEKIKLEKIKFNFKYIFVDESQDLSQEQFEFISLIASNCEEKNQDDEVMKSFISNNVLVDEASGKILSMIKDSNIPKEVKDVHHILKDVKEVKDVTIPAKIVMVGDINQCIYKFQNSDEQILRNFNSELIELNVNYRSTENIINFCNYLKPYHSISTGTGKVGPPVNINVIARTSINKVLVSLLTKYNNYNLHDIAIISPVRKSSKINLGIYSVETFLKQTDLKYQTYYTDYEYETKDTFIKEDHINLLTIHNSKGLQFKVVILLNFHYNAFGKNPTKTEYENFKHMFYVGCSRAQEILEIVVDKTKYIFPEFNKIPKELYTVTDNQKIKILEKLKFTTDDKKDLEIPVTEFISKLDINKYYEIEKLISYTMTEEIMWKESEVNVSYDCPAIIGIYLERLFNYYYMKTDVYDMPEIEIYKEVVKEYSIKEEKPFIVNDPYQNIILSLLYYIKNIKKLAESCPENLFLQKQIRYGKLLGIPDIVQDDVIIDIKFVNNVMMNIMQVFLYCVINNSNKAEIWNFKGKKYKFIFTEESIKNARTLLDMYDTV